MFRGADIEELVKLLEAREASLFHACQLQDFQSYLTLGGIPSRASLEASALPFTAFETDGRDHDVDVWDKVFVNLGDFGTTYARAGKGVPNPYGPILLQIRPAALREASEVAICLRPVGGSSEFDRMRDSLSSLSEVDRLFRHPASSGYPESSYIKFREQLSKEFFPGAQDPDLSCGVASGVLPMTFVSVALVDHYVLDGQTLHERTKRLVAESEYGLRVAARTYSHPRKQMLAEMGPLLAEEPATFQRLSKHPDCSSELRKWLTEIRGLEWQFDRFAKYLREGTLIPIGQDPS